MEQMKITGEMAEKAFLLCDSIEYKNETLYDLIFSQQNSADKIMMMSSAKRREFQEDIAKIETLSGDELTDFNFTMIDKYPEIYKSSYDTEFKIKKMLNLNAAKAKQLAKLFDPEKDHDIFEAVEVCLGSMRFLTANQALSIHETSGSE